jgi:hypothetical protein
MGNANVEIECPHCSYKTGFKFNPGNPYEAGEFDLAKREVAEEHPDHTGRSWKFRQEKTD